MIKLIGILLFLGMSASCFAQIRGTVFLDKNGNGIKDINEKGVGDIKVSDGYNIASTNSDGSFQLDGWDKQRFVTLYPSPDISCKNRYIQIGKSDGEYFFPVSVKKRKDKTSFVQISDTETFEFRDWVDQLKEYSKVHKPDFIVHTGDICYKAGMDWHAKNLTAQQMGVPVYYCLGNHDLIKGDYGEQFFEECFGPAWYAFEEGNTLYVVTPMMGGDYKPGFTREDIGGWLNNLLKVYEKEQPKIFFNHDLLTNSEEFIFRINEKQSINFNEYNLKAWLYGHWHVNMAKEHGSSKIMSYGTSTLVKGGIDHSPSGFRVVHVDEKGETDSQFRWTYLEREIEIVSPNNKYAIVNKQGEIEISVNTYHSGAETDSVKFAIWGEDGFNWNSSLEYERWKHLKRETDWNWRSSFKPEKNGKYELIVDAYLKNGGIVHAKQYFNVSKKENLNVNTNWENLGGNKEHNAIIEFKHTLPYKLEWTSNVGSNIYMSSPVIYHNYVITSGFDDGNANKCFIVCFDASTGEETWKIKTLNGVKNQMVIAKGKLLATDVQGITYAIEIETGKKKWKKDLGYNRLPAFISGIVTDGEIVYTGFGETLCALNVETGNELWRNSEWNGGEGTTPTMTLADDVLVVSRHWGALYGHDKNTGKLLWSRSDDGLRFRDGVVTYADGFLWVAERFNSEEGKLHQIDLKTGKTIRGILTGMQNTGTSAPIVLDSTIIVAGSHPGIASFNRKTGSKIWEFGVGNPLLYTPSYFADKQQSIESTPILLGDKLVFGAMDGCVYVLDAESGRLLWKTELGAPVLTSAAVTGSCFYICDFAGNIYCFCQNETY